MAPVSRHRRFFGPSGRRIALRLAEDLVPLAGPDTHGVSATDVVRVVDRTFALAPWDIQVFLLAGLHAMDFLPLPVIGEVGRYSRLPAAQRSRFLAALESSPLYEFRTLLKLWKGIVLVGYYQDERVSLGLGYAAGRVVAGSRAGQWRPGAP